MINKVALKFAASTLVVGLTMVGCTTAPQGARLASASVTQTDDDTTKLYARLQAAYSAGKFEEAMTAAEELVAQSPRDVGYRLTLAELYLKNGRFQSAETTFGDVLSLNPENVRAALSLALTQIALDRKFQAVITLDQYAASAPAADVGLAYALAGNVERAIQILEPAAREQGATGRVRQNLALSYALAGQWAKARTVTAQDVPAAEVGQRLQQWAAFARPSTSYDQVASLLGVTPAGDPGQPVRLALVPTASEEIQLASAEPVADQAPAVEVAPAATPVPDVEAPPPAPVPAASRLVTAAIPAAPVTVQAPPAPPSVVTRFADAVKSVAALQPSVVRASAAPAVRQTASVTVQLPQARKAAPEVQFRSPGRSRFVVQIGAYRSSTHVESAWASAHRRFGIGKYVPLSTTVAIPGKGTYHRLAVSGFHSQAEALRVCSGIRSRGGACFVRANAGDAPVRWASRQTRRG